MISAGIVSLVVKSNPKTFSQIRHSSNSNSLWSHLKTAPLDGNHVTAAAYDKAESRIASSKSDHEYLPFKGLASFTKLSAEFAFGKENPVLKENKIATVQTISGTGALRVGAEFLGRFRPPFASSGVLLPDPTYVNHYPIFQNNGFQVYKYRYYDSKTNSLDLNGLLEDIDKAPKHTTLLLHACAHNPTGIDPSPDQWKKIAEVAKKRGHIAFFDSAYQGFASGDPMKDSFSYRHFIEQGLQVIVAQSYSKNFGLYGQRVGALNIATSSGDETSIVLSQLNQVIRPMYSNPPAYGAKIVSTILGDPQLSSQWQKDVKTMADRIRNSRQALVDNLAKLGNKRNWSHITNQIGMFAYSGLTKPEVEELWKRHVYLNFDGRMSVSGINSKNVEYLAQAIHEVTK